jgi:hypothetical protein
MTKMMMIYWTRHQMVQMIRLELRLQLPMVHVIHCLTQAHLVIMIQLQQWPQQVN